jgi:signal peptidase II
VGNTLDRLRYGYVIDFIDVHWGAWHWPAFNVADALICVGVMWLLWDQIRKMQRAQRIA